MLVSTHTSEPAVAPSFQGVQTSGGLIGQLNATLNPEQRLAAETTEGPVMIVAGAGTGKTKTLIHRVATLLLKGVPPANIMVVTFTNKAASEIKERLEQMIGENGQYVHAGTFHSIIFRQILQPYAQSEYLLSLKLDMLQCAILDDKESLTLLKDSIADLPDSDRRDIEENEWGVGDFEKIMSEQRARGHDVLDFVHTIGTGSRDETKRRIAAAIWRGYNQRCREVNGIDFDDILVFASKLLKREPHIAEELSRQFRYIMLDEYQDTNPVQMNIMDAIASRHENICVVGDEKQSIYKFRGADIGVILSFQKRYQGTRMIDMNKSYRSYPSIIRFSNAVAAAMTQRLSDGQLNPQRQITESPHDLRRIKGDTVSMVGFEDERAEADTVCRAIMRDMSNGVAPDSIAVLYRNRGLKVELERILVDRNIPYELVGDTSFFQRAEVKDAVALVRFVFNPWDSVAGIRVLKATNMRVSDTAAKKAMKSQGVNVHEFLRQQSEKRLKAKAKSGADEEFTETAKKLRPFIEIGKMIRESAQYGDSPEFISECASELWDTYMRPVIEARGRKSGSEESSSAQQKIDNASQIFRRVHEGLKSGLSISEVIEDLQLMVESTAHNADQTARVQLMTVHASKGLEFDNVYIIGCDNQTTHGESEEIDVEQIEESRRLLYVGMTRAKKKLSISFSFERLHHGKYITTGPSAFIEEIELALGVKKITYETQAKQSGYAR